MHLCSGGHIVFAEEELPFVLGSFVDRACTCIELRNVLAVVKTGADEGDLSAVAGVIVPLVAGRDVVAPGVFRGGALKSKPTAMIASAATSKTPPPSSNSTNTKEFPSTPPIMASFFQKTKSNASPNATVYGD